MIIIDTGQLIHGCIHFLHKEGEFLFEENIRKVFLESIRRITAKFRDDRNIVLAYDNSSWRSDEFSKYKYARKEGRKESDINYDDVFKHFNKIRGEIGEHFGYRIINVNGAEGDDVIATLVKYVRDEDIVIVARDKDFFQLHKYDNVIQYDPVKCETFEFNKNDIDFMLFSHICKGDRGDGIPNIKSSLNFFYDKIVKNLKTRQKSITVKELKEWFYMAEFEREAYLPKEFNKRFLENKKLIDFECIPENISSKIIEAYESEGNKKTAIDNYLFENNLDIFMDNINDF